MEGRQRATAAARHRPVGANPATQRPARLQPAHELHHFFNTTLIGRGAHLEAVRQLPGHADLKTLARYVHANRQRLIDAVNKLE